MVPPVVLEITQVMDSISGSVVPLAMFSISLANGRWRHLVVPSDGKI